MTINLLNRSGMPGRPGPTRKLRLFSRKAAHPVCPDLILKRTVNTLFALILGLIFAACDSASSTDRSQTPYPIVDSGVWSTNSHPGTVYWLDNNRVLFLGNESLKVFKETSNPWRTLLVWDIGKGVNVYKKNIGPLCFQQGTILYGQFDKERNKSIFYRGNFGEEEVYERPENALEDTMNCRYSTSLPGRENGRASRLLLEKDGYIDVGPILGKESSENTPLVLIKPGSKEGITLPFGRREIESLRYYPFKKAYFLYGWYYDKTKRAVHSLWPKGLPHPVWWLMPNGAISELKIPPGVWDAGGGLGFFPTLKGIFIMFHGGAKSVKDPGDQGGYFLRNDKVHKVIDGYVWGPGVSPDGCKVAFSHAPYEDADRYNDQNRRTLKMIDFCIEGNQR